MSAHGLGRSQPLTAPVPVPRSVRFPAGWATIGDLAVGDPVYAVDGAPTTVTYLSAVSDRDVLEVSFDDGQVIQCDPEHLWVCSTAHTRHSPGGLTPTSRDHVERVQWIRVLAAAAAGEGAPGATAAHLASLAGISEHSAAGFARLAGTPHRETLVAAHANPPAAPSMPGAAETTGVLLATVPVRLAPSMVRTYAVDEFLTELANTLDTRGNTPGDLAPVHVTVTATVMAATLTAQYAVTLPAPIASPDADLPVDPYVLGSWLSADPARFASLVPADRSERVLSPIRGMGLAEIRSIPAIYLRASAPQRMALLRALVDADATILGGTVRLPVTGEALLAGVLELVRSLGIKARTVGDGVEFTTNLPVASDPHLAARLNPAVPVAERRLHVVAVNHTGLTAPSRCIQVAHPAHLYLTGGFIPTHNTGPGLA